MTDANNRSGEQAHKEPGSDSNRGLDTNVLVRYLVGDDATQQEEARRFIEETCSPERPGYIHPVMLCELAGVLHSAYGASRDDIAGALRLLLRVRSLIVLDEELVREALGLYEGHQVGFADAFLHAAYRNAGSGGLVTFDRNAAELPGSRRLVPAEHTTSA